MAQEIKSRLEMLDLYFPAYSFKFNKNQQFNDKNKINTNYKVNYAEKKDDKDQIRIEIETTIKDDKESLDLSLTTLAFFKINREGIDDKIAEFILKKNTVAIMMPYIRSQVSLLTTQPGMMPILLQPVDVNAFIDKK